MPLFAPRTHETTLTYNNYLLNNNHMQQNNTSIKYRLLYTIPSNPRHNQRPSQQLITTNDFTEIQTTIDWLKTKRDATYKLYAKNF